MIIKWNKFQKADLKLNNLVDPKYFFLETIVFSGILKIRFSLVTNLKARTRILMVPSPNYTCTFTQARGSTQCGKQSGMKPNQSSGTVHQHHGI